MAKVEIKFIDNLLAAGHRFLGN